MRSGRPVLLRRWEGEPGFGDHVDALVGKVQIADNLVMEALGAGAVIASVVRTPPTAEVLAAGGQFTHQVVDALVEGVAAGFGAQNGHARVGGAVPVGVERWESSSRKV